MKIIKKFLKLFKILMYQEIIALVKMNLHNNVKS